LAASVSELRRRNQAPDDLRDLKIGPRPAPLRERGERQKASNQQNKPKICFHN
jgi:hypothetical protein